MSLVGTNSDPTHAIETLRVLAIRGLCKWLDIRVEDGEALSKEGLGDISAMLAGAEDIPETRLAAMRRLSGRFVVTEPPSWTAAQTRWLSTAFRAGPFAWALALLQSAVRRLFGKVYTRSSATAPVMSDAVALAAWTDPAFRRAVAMLLRRHLRSRVILHPDNGAPPVLAVQSLWVAAADGAKHATLPLRQKQALSLTERLAEQSASVLASHGWAGFWDGYVLSRAKEKGFDLRDIDMRLDFRSASSAAPQYRKTWRDGVPGFAGPLLAGTL